MVSVISAKLITEHQQPALLDVLMDILERGPQRFSEDCALVSLCLDLSREMADLNSGAKNTSCELQESQLQIAAGLIYLGN